MIGVRVGCMSGMQEQGERVRCKSWVRIRGESWMHEMGWESEVQEWGESVR